MSQDAKSIATELFDFVVGCYPDALTGLNIPNSPIVYRTYLYGVLKATMKAKMDQYAKMHLLNMLRNEIGLSADQLAAEILKYAADQD